MNERNDYHNCRLFHIDRDNKAENDMRLILESVLKYKICLKKEFDVFKT
jgi:hypothetical protein